MKERLDLTASEIVDPASAADRLGRLPAAPLAMPKQRLEPVGRGWIARLLRAGLRGRAVSDAARRGGS